METVDNYTLTEEIGGGNFGKVYKAVNRSGSIFAVKKIMTRGINQKLRSLIDNEIETLKTINHKNVLRLEKVISTNSHVYIVTELCEGGDLENYLKKNTNVSYAVTKKWIKDLVLVMKTLKDKNILHRDLKIANLLLSHKNVELADIKLCDFGFSKYLTSSITGTQLGTPLYMAPEIFTAESYNFKVDIWSLGIVAYEILCGKGPFQCYNLQELRKLQQMPIKFSVDIPEVAKDFVLKLLTYNPAERPDYEQLISHPFISEQLAVPKLDIVDEDYDLCEDYEENPAPALIKEKVSENNEKVTSENLPIGKEEKQPVEEAKTEQVNENTDGIRTSAFIEKEIQNLGINIQTQMNELNSYLELQSAYSKDREMSYFLSKFRSERMRKMIIDIDQARRQYQNCAKLAELLDEAFIQLQMDLFSIDTSLEESLKKSRINDDAIRMRIINEGFDLAQSSAPKANLIFSAAFFLYPDDEVIFDFLHPSN